MIHANNRHVNVSRQDLLETLLKGREAHAQQYEQAKADYAEAAEKFLAEALERVRAGDLSNIVFKLQRPENHVGDYDEVIKMMEHSVDEVISLDSSSFRAYFMGEWGWKRDFDFAMASIGGYLGKR